MKLWIGMSGLLFSLIAQADESAFKVTKEAFAMMEHGCNIRLQVPVRARVTSSPENRGSGGVTLENPFDLKTKNYVEPFYFGLICYAVDRKLSQGEPVRYNEQDRKWERDITNRFEPWYSETGKKELDRATNFYELNAINANGYAYTEDDTFGDEQWRQRRLSYCLIRGPKALCGNGKMGYLKEGKEGDLTPYALQILRSIEFLDEVPASTPPNDAGK